MAWEISILELKINGYNYKVTKRNPDFSISETKFFKTKDEALKQFNEWLDH